MNKGKITTDKKIEIYDETGSNDSFEMSELLCENDETILCKVHNEWYDGDFTVLIYKESREVVSKDFDFYLAHNI